MAADVTLIVNGVESVLAELYPTISVYRTKRPVAGGKPPNGGWNPGWKLPCFVLSSNEPEEVDADGDFENVTVTYNVLIEFVKASAAVTQGGESPVLLEDEEFREKRQAIRRRLYKPGAGGVSPVNVQNRNRSTYDTSGTGGAIVTVSGMIFRYEVSEPRAE
ncbi:hypothetical protein VT84_09405 [Gemmata sp. SH-PL17]|uniref:hypothetical protein n=1 Tax=Gemmata sp. SH-PL17 TaxID=1630693 RepID=UPI00078DF5D8|nr:hypothetical protein [Gemmata sp. SH-PL17]AMV24600.1 hypothetical protein VT84_09405 [Gemmata sp. SH-PL17]